MTSPTPLPTRTDLADGQWHRLHPATPLLRGGIVLIAILGFVIANLRERVVEFFIAVFAPDTGDEFGGQFSDWRGDWANDPVGGIVSNGLIGWALVGVALIILFIIGGFYLSWRMHSFRITDEAVEVRSGILFRSHRSARLDRIQGINIARPVIPRLVGAAKLELAVAGQSANVQLAYLNSQLADALRGDILRLASGARAAVAGGGGGVGRVQANPAAAHSSASVAPAASVPTEEQASARHETRSGESAESAAARISSVVVRRVDEFLAPELDPDLAPPESVVHIPVRRIIGSTLLGGTTVIAVVMIGLLVWGVWARQFWVLFAFIPGVIGLLSYVWTRITRSLRYSIAGTPDGVRVGYGLLSTANQTLPPGRIHAIQVLQPLLWRPFGWWMIRINFAGHSLSASSASAQKTIVLPVGLDTDVHRVLALLLPDTAPDELAEPVALGLTGRGDDDIYTRNPRRAAWVRLFSWRRTGYAVISGIVLLRRGIIVRDVILLPLARIQSIAVHQGPYARTFGLAWARVHTVTGPITPTLPVATAAAGRAFFDAVSAGAVEWAAREGSESERDDNGR